MTQAVVPAGKLTPEINELIGLLYDTATDESGWTRLLQSMEAYFRGCAGQYCHYDLRDDKFSFMLFHDLDHLPVETFKRYAELTPEDPRLIALKRIHGERPTSTAMHCRDLVSDEELHASRIYQEVLKPSGVEYVISAHLVDGDVISMIAVMRGPHQPCFTDHDTAQITLLLPHLQRVARIRKQFAKLDFAARSSLDALDKFPTGLVIVDEHFKVQAVNRAAGLLLDRDDGIALRGGSIVVENPARGAEIVDAARTAISSARAGRMQPGRSFAIPRRDGGTFTLHVSTLWGNQLRFGLAPLAEPLAVLFIADPAQPLEPSPEALKRFFGLTDAEARLASLLASGHSLSACAKDLGRSVETCRAHLKAIFGKINVSRQGDLIRLILTTPAWIDPA